VHQADALISQSKAAEVMKVSRPSVQRAAEVVRKAAPETVKEA
jgi:hypothetical protein